MTAGTRTVLSGLLAASVAVTVSTVLLERARPRPVDEAVQRARSVDTAAGRWAALAGLVAGLAAAAVLAGLTSRRLERRLHLIAEAARRYRQGEFNRPEEGYGRDEVGRAADVLDAAVRDVGARLTEMGRERTNMDAIVNGMVEGIVLVNRAGRLVLTNPAVRSMLRLPPASSGQHYLEVVRHPDIAGQLSSALAGQVPQAVEVELAGEGRRVFIARVMPVDRARGGGAVLVLHDISDLRQANQVRRDFVANVSHELRTPLTAIRGYVEALLDDAPPPAVQAREFLEIIARHALRMDRLVRDLLRLARLDAGQETLERVDRDVADLVAGVQHDLQPQFEARGQRLQIAIAPDAATVAGDASKLHDVLRNLIENASNYSPEGGVIEVRARRDGPEVEITVADRGPGVPPADLSRIFERFYRVDRSRSRDPGGTGLGLSIVRHLVELHGGRVSAANRDGGGAVFTVRLRAE